MKDGIFQGVGDEAEVNRDRAATAVARLDGAPLIEMLCRPAPDGPGWSSEKAERAFAEYRKFLFLNAVYPRKRIVPTKLVDEVWHAHILDTRKYAADCSEVFGYFLHHYPYFGLRGDVSDRDDAFYETRELYTLEFDGSVFHDPLKFGTSKDEEQNGCEAGDLQAAGCDPGDVRAAGCDAGDVRAAGCDAGDITTAGCDQGDIQAAVGDDGEIRD